MKLECIGCREIKDFSEYSDYPVCEKCKEWEKKHLEEINSPGYMCVQRDANEYRKKNIPSDIRWDVWERDNFTCRLCGSRKNLTVDHIIPESKGGQMTIDNAQTLCKTCNSRKGSR